MCGIVGVFPLNSPNLGVSPAMRRGLAFWFHNELLFHTIKRGKDATGMALAFGPQYEGEGDPYLWAVLKQPVDAEDFFLNDGTDKRYTGQKKNANIEFLMGAADNLKRPLIHILGHARAKTTGSELNPMNNHPILVGNIIGIHNGGVKNYKKIFEKHPNMTAIGEVDSEAIFQLLAENANDRPLDEDAITYTTQRIEGPRSVLAYNRNFPEKVAFFRDGERPLELAVIRELGLMIVCSDRDFFRSVSLSYQRMRLLYSKGIPGEGKLPKLTVDWNFVTAGEGGIIDTTKPFENSTSIQKFTGLKKFPDTMNEYKSTTVITGNNYKGGTTTPTSTTTPRLIESEASGEAEVQDLSEYEDAAGEATLALVPVSTDKVMDDASPQTPTTEVVTTLEIEDDPGDFVHEETVDLTPMAVSGDQDAEWSDDELRSMAHHIILDSDFQKSPKYLLNRMEISFQDLLGAKEISHEKAQKITEYLYPEAFSDGFIYGFEFAQERDEENQVAEDDDEMPSEEVALLEAKLNRAVVHMANLKAFVLAALISKDLIDVDTKGEVFFDEVVEDFIDSPQNGFEAVDMGLIRSLFSQGDKRAIVQTALGKVKTKKLKKST